MTKKRLDYFIVDVDDNGITGDMLNLNDLDGTYVLVNRKGKVLNGIAPYTSITVRYCRGDIEAVKING